MRHRIFLAINLPPHIKDNLVKYQKRAEKLFNDVSSEQVVRWTRRANLHITLVFIGSIKEQALPKILEETKRIVEKHNTFEVGLKNIVYAPPGKMPPRMVWVTGKKTDQLLKLQEELSKALLDPSSPKKRRPRRRPYSPHITLGRIKKWGFKRIEPEDRPRVKRDISSVFRVHSIEVMESHLKRSGAEYEELASFSLAS